VSAPLSNGQIQDNFTIALYEASTRGEYSTDQGFDPFVDDAILRIAKSFPNATVEMIRKARQEIAIQLDPATSPRTVADWALDQEKRIQTRQ
jgi:hypothetical protein